MAKQIASKQTDTVTETERVLAAFETERNDLLARQAAIADKRRLAAYDAHNGDAAASKLLDGLHEEAIRFQSRLAGLDDAIAEAKRRVQQAREREQKVHDREKAAALRAALMKFRMAGLKLDAVLLDLVSASADLRDARREMQMLGCNFPSDAQLDSLGAIALRSALMQTPWTRYFERVGPTETKTFAKLIAQWSDMVERNFIALRLGDGDQTRIQDAIPNASVSRTSEAGFPRRVQERRRAEFDRPDRA